MNPRYHCPQGDLYTVARSGWNNCKSNIGAFSDLRPIYTTAYCDDRLAEIATTAALADDATRSETTKTLHVNLYNAASESIDTWKTLRQYIKVAFPKDVVESKLKAAGSTHLTKASRKNWDHVDLLLQNGLNFINANLAVLSANQNMPATFPAQFTQVFLDFVPLHDAFIKSENEEKIATQLKIKANNDAYEKLQQMFSDGKHIFRKDEALRDSFDFKKLLHLVSGSGTSGISGVIVDAVTGRGISDVTVTIAHDTRMATTDLNGKFKLSRIAAGTYTIVFSKPGYADFTLPKHEIKLGTIGRVKISMAKV